jgi:hypothetical protein
MKLPFIAGTCHYTDFFIYSACDEHYFDEFGRAFVNSIHANSSTPVHLHLFNPRPDQLEFCTQHNVSVSYEHVPLQLFEEAAQNVIKSDQYTRTLTAMQKGNDRSVVDRMRKTYYACARFIRLHTIVNSSVLALDVDAIVRQHIGPLDHKHDLYLHRIFGKKARCLAGGIYLNGSVLSKKFMHEYAVELQSSLEADCVYWGVDQDLLDSIVPRYNYGQLPSGLIDWHMNADSAVWTAKGNRKSLEVFVNEQKKYSF